MRIGLSLKIIGTVLFVSFFFFFSLAYVNIKSSRKILEETYLERAKTIARLLEASIKSREALGDKCAGCTFKADQDRKSCEAGLVKTTRSRG